MWNDYLPASKNTWFAWPHKWSSCCAPYNASSAASCGVGLDPSSQKAFQQFRSSANIVSVKCFRLSACLASPKCVFHRWGPSTVPWNTLSVRGSAAEHAPPSTTCEVRSSSQLARKPTASGCRPLAPSSPQSRVRHTLSKAPFRSEQKTPTARFLSRSNSHEHTFTVSTSL